MKGRTPPTSTGLTRPQFWGVLAAVLAIFALAAGPVWRHPWSIEASVLLSYLAIPPMVVGVLLLSHRFTWRDLALDTLKVTLAKFGVTYVAAAALWAISGEPPPLPPVRPQRLPPAPAAASPAVAPSVATTLDGVVTVAGAPRAGAVVWVARGVEGHAYPPRTDVMEILDDGRGFVPPIAAVQTGQPLLLRSGDGQLHALRGADARGRMVFNVAVTSVSARVRLHEAAGVLSLSCVVHDHFGKERPGRLVALAHPFFATTDAGGRFHFEGLPPGHIILRALDADLGETSQTVELPSRRPVALTLAVTRAQP